MTTGDVGARKFMQRHPEAGTYVDWRNPGSGMDIDTPKDLQLLAGDLCQRQDPCVGGGGQI
ncbi:hypothetical protein AB0323_12000 [Arthrobacter sp. NPDC080031]|uniref:hypothetical protein n=1 Tax=Arthrobacter sp. NPDC080031 TaxID=3155918 RepID=UPI00344DA138